MSSGGALPYGDAISASRDVTAAALSGSRADGLRAWAWPGAPPPKPVHASPAATRPYHDRQLTGPSCADALARLAVGALRDMRRRGLG